MSYTRFHPESESGEQVRRPPQSEQTSPTRNTPDWGLLIAGIQRRDSGARQQFSDALARGVSIILRQRTGSKVTSEAACSLVLKVVEAVENRDLNDAEELPGFVRRMISESVGRQCIEAPREVEKAQLSKIQAMTDVLAQLPEADRLILSRYYLHGESEESILATTKITVKQFRRATQTARDRFNRLNDNNPVSIKTMWSKRFSAA